MGLTRLASVLENGIESELRFAVNGLPRKFPNSLCFRDYLEG